MDKETREAAAKLADFVGELIQKYYDAESSVIYDRGTNTRAERQALETEKAELDATAAALIANLIGQARHEKGRR